MNLLKILKEERDARVKAIYREIQINLAYNSNKIEGSTISKNQTRYIFDEKSVYPEESSLKINDIIETRNHFKAFDYILDIAKENLSENHILTLHKIIKHGISNINEERFPIGAYKKEENVIGSIYEIETTKPEDVKNSIIDLLNKYNNKEKITLNDIVDFHVKFEKIHPFYDGNGRVGRLILFKECLRHDITPSIILDEYRSFYLLGLREYQDNQTTRLIETFKAGQDYVDNIISKYKTKN